MHLDRASQETESFFGYSEQYLDLMLKITASSTE